jgi:hypothetical protein
VQRLFSMFPAGSAGVALLLLRLAVAATLVLHFVRYWPSSLPSSSILVSAFIVLPLAIGLLTPLTSILCCLIEVVVLCRVGFSQWPYLVLSIMYATALAILGPGAYSLDGRRFGRRLIVSPDAISGDPSDP